MSRSSARRLFRNRRHRRWNWWMLSTLLLGVIAIGLSIQLIFGDMGFVTLVRKERALNEVSEKLDAATTERLELESRVKLLQDGSLDLDMLEEQAKKNLGYANPDEKLILLKPEPPSPQPDIKQHQPPSE